MRILLCVAIMLIAGYAVRAQTVTGHVTSAQDQGPLPGVSVLIKGTTVGTTTDMDGGYKLSVSDPNATLVFSFIGFAPKEIALNGRSAVDVQLEEDITQLGEVVVTAFGIERQEKSLGYAVSTISADEITEAASTNFASALYGKAAGVRISSAPGGASSAVNVQVRGINSLSSKNNSPLYVIDGVMIRNNGENGSAGTNNSGYWGDPNIRGNGVLDINPNDIASMTILKGASAAALYGSEASNGVVVITTKAGKAGKGLGIEVNYDFTVEDVAFTPKYQNSYGPGFDRVSATAELDGEGFVSVDIDGDNIYESQRPDFEAWGQFGPKIDGRDVVWWDGSIRKYKAHPNNYKNMYRQGSNSNFNVAMSGGNEKGTYRLSFTRRDYKAISRGSDMNRNTVNFNTRLQLHKKLTADVVVQYVNNFNHNRPRSINRITHNYGGFFSRADDMGLYLNKYKTSEGYKWVSSTNSVYNPDEALAFPINATALLGYFWSTLRNSDDEYKDRVISSVTLNYDIGKGFSIRGRAGNDFTSTRREVDSYNEYPIAFNTSSSSSTGGYKQSQGRYSIVYGDAFLTYTREFSSDLNLTLMAGTQAKKENYLDMSSETTSGLIQENWFALDNSTGTVKSNVTRGYQTMFAYMGTADLNYRDYLFLQATARKEWVSTLRPGHNDYFYPSVNLGFMLSQVVQMPSFVDFAKLRVSEAGIANGAPRYQSSVAYTQSALQTSNNGSVPTLAAASSYGNLNLKPERKTETEFGFATGFLQKRLGLDVTYYSNVIKDQILNVSMPYSSGASSLLQNVGRLHSSGIEVGITGTPVRGPLRWDVAFNFARNKTIVRKLSNGSDELNFGTTDSSVQIKADAGEELGNLYAFVVDKDENGNKIVTDDGLYQLTNERKKIGNAIPNAVGGLSNTFSYKAFSFNMMIDYSFGGKIVSAAHLYQYGAGMYKSTMKYRDEKHGGIAYNIDANDNVVLAASHDDAAYHDGVILKGVTSDGSTNQTLLPAGYYYRYSFGWGDGRYAEQAILDNDWVKLREMVFSYTLPAAISGKLHFQSIRVSLVGRNLFYLYRTLENLDAEVATGSFWKNQIMDRGSSAATRSYGFTVRAKF